MWQNLRLHHNDNLFRFLYEKIRSCTNSESEKEISVLNKRYRTKHKYLVKMEWQGENICGLDFFIEMPSKGELVKV